MKSIKKILCLVLTLLLCFSLISCNRIDEMREMQVHFNDNKNIVYDGHEYMLLPECEAFNPKTNFDKYVFLTEKDVPVLLSEMFGSIGYVSEDNNFITMGGIKYTNQHYARAGVYDKIVARINNGNYFDGYGFYYAYVDGAEEIPSHRSKFEFISNEVKEVIDIIMSGQPEEDIDISLLYQFENFTLFASSDDLMFNEDVLTIYKTESHIYLLDDNKVSNIYKVPKEHYDAINSIIERHNSLEKDYYNNRGEYIIN